MGTITPKQLTLDLVGSTRFDKTYDGNANVTQTLTKGTNYTLTGFVTGEGMGIALGSSAGTYSDKNAAADKTVTFGGLTLTGARGQLHAEQDHAHGHRHDRAACADARRSCGAE